MSLSTLMILNIPHSSRNLLGRTFLCDVDVELYRMTDHRTDVLFDVKGAIRIVFSIIRLVCDVERFLIDDQEPAAQRVCACVISRIHLVSHCAM